MTMPQEDLLETLEKLRKEEFEKFKWYLNQEGVLEDFTSIPMAHLEDANRFNTVDQMVQTYGSTNAIKVTVKVLTKMKKTELVNKITGTIKEPTDAKRDTEQSVQPEDWMTPVRDELIDGLSEANVNQILDILYQEGVFNAQEKKVIREQTAADKAQKLIEGVHKRGPNAWSFLKAALREVNKFLFKNLNLT